MATTDEKQKQLQISPTQSVTGDRGPQPPPLATQDPNDLDLTGDTQQTQMQRSVPPGSPEPGMDGMGMGMDDNSLPGMDAERTPEELYADVIRKYEMKKIYHRLHSIENFLYNNNTFDINIIRLQRHVSSAIELFDYVVENLKAYRNDIDVIIKTFNNLIDHIYSLLRDYAKKLKNSPDEAKKE